MSSFVQRFSDGSIWGCIDDFFRHHEYGYIKLKNIEEWYALGKDDVDWKTRVVKEKVFHMQTQQFTRIHETDTVLAVEKFPDSIPAEVSDAVLKTSPVKPDAIIFDCDGVLLDCDLPPWQPQAKITPRVNTVSLLRLLWRQSPRHPKIIILTGRPERIRKLTETQLLNNGIFCDELLMNNLTSGGETSPGHQFKIRKLPELMEKYNIIGMFEDDPQVIQSVRTIYPEISTYHVYD